MSTIIIITPPVKNPTNPAPNHNPLVQVLEGMTNAEVSALLIDAASSLNED